MVPIETEQYLQQLIELRDKDDQWTEIEKDAKERYIPIMDKPSINFVKQLLRLHQPKTILEIGTAIGYSALQMKEAHSDASIITIEKDLSRYEEATDRIGRNDQAESIEVIHGDALDVLQDFIKEKRTFDFIFIDAAKGQYKKFFDYSTELLSSHGLIVTDNVLFRGFVANHIDVPKRFKTMVQKLQTFNEYIIMHPLYMTEIVPIGDGIAISIKKE